MKTRQQIHPLFEIILDNWRLHGFATEKESSKKTNVSTMAKGKAKNLYPFPNRLEKKAK